MAVFYHAKRLVFIAIILFNFTILALTHGTRVGFYETTCPRAEAIVHSVVKSAVQSNPTIAPGLLRMFFHDCFVHGCDASILLDGPSTEKTAGPNSRLRGFEMIHAAKSLLEMDCPGVVSCADILALAARDSVVMSGGTYWKMPTGRRDGLVSRKSDATNLPGFSDPVNVQIKKFDDKGLNIEDLVTLVGGHTIGTAACSLFRYRLYNHNNSSRPDPAIDKAFLPHLRSLCANGGNDSRRVSLDTGSVYYFDNSYYVNLRRGRGVLESDSNLWTDPRTKRFVERFLEVKKPHESLIFNAEFGRSMVKLGNLEVKTGNEGEIRRVCNAVN